jgi:hypothetical protein
MRKPDTIRSGGLPARACSVGVGVQTVAGPDEERDADTDAFAAGLISITPMDGDMAVGGKGAEAIEDILGGLTP